MNSTLKRASAHAGIGLWTCGCSAGDPLSTYPVTASDAGAATPIAVTDAAVFNPFVPDVIISTPVAVGPAVVGPSVPDAEVPCGQTGAAACDDVLGAMCQRFNPCCRLINA